MLKQYFFYIIYATLYGFFYLKLPDQFYFTIHTMRIASYLTQLYALILNSFICVFQHRLKPSPMLPHVLTQTSPCQILRSPHPHQSPPPMFSTSVGNPELVWGSELLEGTPPIPAVGKIQLRPFHNPTTNYRIRIY